MPKPQTEPTEKQLELWRALIVHVANNGFQPSLNELAEILGISKTATYQRLRRLQNFGLVELSGGEGERCIQLNGVHFSPVFKSE